MSSQNEYKSYAYFTVTSERPLAEIEAHMGIVGDDRTWNVGDHRKAPGTGHYSFSRWSLQSGIEIGAPLDEHLQSIWRRVAPYRAQVCELPSSMQGFIQCVAFFKTHRDHLSLAAGHFSTAASYRLIMDFDFYYEDDFGHEGYGQPYWSW